MQIGNCKPDCRDGLHRIVTPITHARMATNYLIPTISIGVQTQRVQKSSLLEECVEANPLPVRHAIPTQALKSV